MTAAGVSEGRPRNVVAGSGEGPGRDGDARWFSTSESAHPAPWIELHLPCNVTLLRLQNYTFTHGHHRSSYFRSACTSRCMCLQPWHQQGLGHAAARMAPTAPAPAVLPSCRAAALHIRWLQFQPRKGQQGQPG